jgi:6-phosphogluconolactonase
MKIEVFADADLVAREAAAIIAAEARASVAAHGRFIAAFSGGHTPWLMLRALADETVPWAGVHVAQVDERVAPAGDPDRNLTHLRESLLEHAPLRPEQIYAMPVESLDTDVAVTGIYQGRRRMTLTYPILNRSRRVLWVVTGSEKTQMLVRLHQGDQSIPSVL